MYLILDNETSLAQARFETILTFAWKSRLDEDEDPPETILPDNWFTRRLDDAKTRHRERDMSQRIVSRFFDFSIRFPSWCSTKLIFHSFTCNGSIKWASLFQSRLTEVESCSTFNFSSAGTSLLCLSSLDNSNDLSITCRLLEPDINLGSEISLERTCTPLNFKSSRKIFKETLTD